MKFCSECGAKLSRPVIAQDSCKHVVCGSCGVTHYQNPRVIVSCCVYREDKVLMCRRAEDPARGQWAPPLGFLECGETLEEGAARETLEETGVRVDPNALELYAVMNMPRIEQIAVCFRVGLAHDPEVRAGAECIDVRFFSKEEWQACNVAWIESLGTMPHQLFEQIRTGIFSIHLTSIASENGIGYRSRSYVIDSPALT